mmetsp:Transcript_27673/g.84900  ORF Transcript_27673/g.84900 Transcript_27673/m.84900 type:complete len:1030 (-) Transcript_27673:262-3351(-)
MDHHSEVDHHSALYDGVTTGAFSLVERTHSTAHVAFESRRYDGAWSCFATMLQQSKRSSAGDRSASRSRLCHESVLLLEGHLRSNRSVCMLRRGNAAAAIPDALVSVTVCPHWCKAWYRLGRLLLASGEASAAEVAFTEGSKFDISAVTGQLWWQHRTPTGPRGQRTLDFSMARDVVPCESARSSPVTKDDSHFATTVVETVDELHELMSRKQQSGMGGESRGSKKAILAFVGDAIWAHQSERPGDFCNETLTLYMTRVASYLEQASAVDAPKTVGDRHASREETHHAFDDIVAQVATTHLQAGAVHGAWLFLGAAERCIVKEKISRQQEHPAACFLPWNHYTVSRLVDYSVLQAWKTLSPAALCVATRIPKGSRELEELLGASSFDVLDSNVNQCSTSQKRRPCRSVASVIADPSELEDGLLQKGLTQIIRHTRRRLCTQHSLVLPFQAVLMIAPCSVAMPTHVYPEAALGKTTESHDIHWSPWYETVHVDASFNNVRLLAPPKPCFAFNFASPDVELGLPVRLSSEVEFKTVIAGTINAIIFWYDLLPLPMQHVESMMPDCSLAVQSHLCKSGPSSADSNVDERQVTDRRGLTSRRQALQWVDPVSLALGQRVVVHAKHTCTRAMFRTSVPVCSTPPQHVATIPRWYLSLLTDEARCGGYQAGLLEAISSGNEGHGTKRNVLVLGAGSGRLSFLAAKAGASLVIGVDDEISLLRAALQLAGNMKRSLNVHFILGSLNDLQIGHHFSERFDVLLLEKFDVGLLGFGTLALVHLAWTRFLKPNATVIPRRGRVYACCVNLNGDGDDAGNHWRPYQYGRQYSEIHLNARHIDVLTHPVEVFNFDLNNREVMIHADALEGTWRDGVAAIRGGHVNAVCFWFELDFASNAAYTVSSGPNSTSSQCWSQACQAVDGPIVQPGEVIEMFAYHRGSNITFSACYPSRQAIRVARPMCDDYWLRLYSKFLANSRDFATTLRNGTTRRDVTLAAAAIATDPARFARNNMHMLGSKGNDAVWWLLSDQGARPSHQLAT